MSGHISTNVTSPSFPAISQAASVPTERALKDNFDQDGNRKDK